MAKTASSSNGYQSLAALSIGQVTIDAPGIDALGLISSLASFTPSQQLESEVAKQTSPLIAAGAAGRGVLHDIDVFVQGINAYLAAHGDTLGIFPHVKPFTRLDIYGFNALKDQFVGEGGGRHVAGLCPRHAAQIEGEDQLDPGAARLAIL